MGATAVAIPADAAATVADASAPPAVRDALVARIKANVDAQMAINRKSAALKGLQAHIWREGYASGALKGQVFPDTPGAIGAWVAGGRKVYIYSSGSREAQRYLFASVAGVGDMRPSLSGFFDIPSAGMKTEPASYRSIVDSVGADAPSQVLFATDALAEAVAAAEAGLQVVITERPGNVALPKGHGFPVVRTLLEIEAAASAAAAAGAASAQ
jgi:2,3-diketo-5-methylthio-1-phosphopentane phosphatase